MAQENLSADTTDLTAAQRELRFAYRSASVGQIYAGMTWLASAVVWSWVGGTTGAIVLFVAGIFIYPVTAGVSRLMGNPGVIPATNPLKEAGVTIPIVGVLGIPVAAAAALYDVNWFYPAFMVIMGAHYLPFSLLYGMKVFIPLGAAMWFVGLVLGFWAPELAVAGAWFTGLVLIGVGVFAARRYREEFGNN